MKVCKMIFKSIIAVALLITMIPGSLALASEKENLSDRDFTIITQSDSLVVYEMKEDDKVLRYEENIVESGRSTNVYTKVFDVTNGVPVLKDEFNTYLEFDDHQSEVKITQENDLEVETETISLPTENTDRSILPENDSSKSMFRAVASSWVSSRMPKINIGYRYPDDAKYAGMYKYNVKVPNKSYDQFTRQVDSMRSREVSLVKEGSGIAAAQTLADLVFGKVTLSWSAAWKLMKRIGAPISVGYNAFQWFLSYDKAVDYFYATPPKTTPGTIPH
ncbi:hypothetical protein [Rossellomorea aquimaris]|uniref:hypothetical protein n=1 Tax=Rossellomorea aquimaris TaxID=189382 RepID=UPI001CFE91BB|nr:hypothetical protein [Rossellomorea aquimaris]